MIMLATSPTVEGCVVLCVCVNVCTRACVGGVCY